MLVIVLLSIHHDRSIEIHVIKLEQSMWPLHPGFDSQYCTNWWIPSTHIIGCFHVNDA